MTERELVTIDAIATIETWAASQQGPLALAA